MSPPQLFHKLLLIQYRLDTTPAEHCAQLFEDFDETMQQLVLTAKVTEDQIHDALAERYPSFAREQNGR
jgi:hypothetical protein